MEVSREEVDKGVKKGKIRKDASLLGSMLAMDVNSESEEEDEDEDVRVENGIISMLESRSEVDRYLQFPKMSHIIEIGQDVDVLEWWKRHSKKFPHLAKMARRYLALPCSSAGRHFKHCNLM